MGRLTECDSQGNWCVKGLPWKDTYVGQTITDNTSEKTYSALCKLKDYEDTGLEPEGILALKRHERWIPVQERLPKAKEDVLVCTKSGWILIAWYGPNGQRWHITPTGITHDDIVAWMPLPEPYHPEVLREVGTEAGQYADAPVIQPAT